MLTQIILIVLIFAVSIVAGIVLRKLTKEELKDGRRWFLAIIVVSLISALVLIIVYRNWAMILALVLVSIISYISWRK